tara:strand:+ start:521 stop:910 length:390 start_codon:yes stop_codon:yes gene_type:complete
MSEKFIVEIISPDKSILKTETTEVIIPSYEGEIGILRDHIPLITFLRPGLVIIKKDDTDKIYFVEEGTVEFVNNNLLILTSSVKILKDLHKNYVSELIEDAESKIKNNEMTDKQKYLLGHKLDILKNIS